jgi:hypothetical protein
VVQIEEETCTRQLWYGKACMYIHTAVRYLVWVNVFLNDNRHETLYSEGSFLNGFSSLHRKKISRLANVVAWPFFRLGSKFLPSPTLKKNWPLQLQPIPQNRTLCTTTYNSEARSRKDFFEIWQTTPIGLATLTMFG